MKEIVNNEENNNPAENIEETVENTQPETVVENVAEETTEKVEDAVEETAKETKVAAPKAEVIAETPHDDFDWSVDKKHTSKYDEKTSHEYDEMYEKTLTTVNDNELVNATVTSITDSDAVLNIGFKSDGMVSLSEFRDMPDLKVGDEVLVYVVTKEDPQGQLVLSRKNAKIYQAWENIVDAYKNDTIVKGTIVSKTKGGLIANVFGMDTFLPGSQIDVKPITDYDQFVGKTMEFKVVKINEIIKNAVVSHKALIESDLEDQRQEIISHLEKGQVLEGVIKNITDFGAFIDLGGVDGLLYITDISWGRINHPNEVLELNQKINVAVLDFDDNKKRISLGLKQLQPHPWDELEKDLEVGAKVKGKIVNIEDYGAFLEIKPGVEGLIHVSEISWSNQPINSRDFFKMDEEYEAVIMTIDREERKMSLSLKRMTEDPWEKGIANYPVDSKHTGEIKNITPYGVFVELSEGIGGMIHISDLSWTKRFNHPSEFCKVGDKMDVVVLEVDSENRKLSLGHKQLEADPWDTFEEVFPVGSSHEGVIIAFDDKGGARVGLPYGLEGYAPKRHLKKEDGSNPKVDDTLEMKIIDFNRNEKKIMVSHSRYWEDNMKEAKDAQDKAKKSEDTKTRKAVKNLNQNSDKTTLGDIDALAELKQKMEDDAKAKSTIKKKSTKKDKEEEGE